MRTPQTRGVRKRAAHLPRMRPILVLCLSLIAVMDVLGASVVDFGAVGDGLADDTAAIQRALDAGQGPVDLPIGRYRISDTLVVPSNSGLTGRGTLYQTADLTTLTNNADTAPTRNILIEGIRIEKEFVDNSVRTGITFDTAHNVVIRGVEVTGLSAREGILLLRTQFFTIADCYVHDFSASIDRAGVIDFERAGICAKASANGQIVNNRIENLVVSEESAAVVGWQTDGITLGGCESVVVSGNVIRNTGEGIDLMVSESCVVTGNTLDNSRYFGIKLVHGTHMSSITGNTVRGAGLAGIVLYYGEPQHGQIYGNTIAGNTVLNVGAASSNVKTWEFAGIQLQNDPRAGNEVHDNVVTGNVVYDTQARPTCWYGIQERFDPGNSGLRPADVGLSTNNVIRSNRVVGVKKAPYQSDTSLPGTMD